MTPEERARALVGDMPWVVENLTGLQLKDLIKQVTACIQAAIDEDRRESGKYFYNPNEIRA